MSVEKLIEAVKQNDEAAVLAIVAGNPDVVNAFQDDKQALDIAAANGNLLMVKLLHNLGASLLIDSPSKNYYQYSELPDT